MNNKDFLWWKHGVVYQIYPRSFLDTTGNGVGDLPGIIKKLDYVKSLGVHAIWINPFFQSPMADFGYDISDFQSVDPLFGSNTDMLTLISEAHKRGLKVIFDMVFNHTSSEHPWFVESRSSLDNPKRDWYIWNEKKPNNWQSLFGGSAWEKCDFTNQYYYHFFLSEQPDLNLRNPEVIAEIKKIIEYYLDIGVDGFRLDAVNTYFEDENLMDNPDTDYCPAEYTIDCQIRKYNFDHHHNYNFLAEIKKLIDSYPGERMLVGEVAKDGHDKDAWKKYYGDAQVGLDLVFNFDFLYNSPNVNQVTDIVKAWESLEMHNWPTYVFSSHDQIRGISRYVLEGDSIETEVKKAKTMAIFLLTVRGTPFIYYGQEITMNQYTDLTNDQIKDPWAIRTNFTVPTRDGCRTPMQWDGTKNAGFSTSEYTWLPISKNYPQKNVEVQNGDPNSILNFYRKVIQIRSENPALFGGKLELLEDNPDFVSYTRELDGQKVLIIINFCEHSIKPESECQTGNVLISEGLNNGEIEPFGFAVIEKN